MNTRLLTDKCFDIAIRLAASKAKEGWQLNPNEKVVRGIIKGVFRCDGDCPCDNHSEDLQCPCSGYRLHDHCCCQLYVQA